MLVRDLMSESVVAVDASAQLRDAVLAMLREGVGSVIVRRDGAPTGIITETDALMSAAETGRPLADVAVEDAMTSDLVTGSPDMTVRKAVGRMNRQGVKKLPIVEDFDVVGIVTMTDVVRHHASLIREAHRAEERSSSRWDTD
ncbi:MAG: CBS domain-containing protein [Halanaeroarchaeum sp.]